MTHRVTIKDVARAAGVATATASHALNRNGTISPATADHVQRVAAAGGTDLAKDFAERERAHAGPKCHQSDEHSEIADAIDDECFFCCVACEFLFVPKSDEQIGAKPNAFPTEEHEQEIISKYKI